MQWIKEIKKVDIEWRGKTVTLKHLTVNDIIEFENITNIQLDQLRGNLKMSHLRALMWIGLKKSMPDIKIEEIGDIDFQELNDPDSPWMVAQNFFLRPKQTAGVS